MLLRPQKWCIKVCFQKIKVLRLFSHSILILLFLASTRLLTTSPTTGKIFVLIGWLYINTTDHLTQTFLVATKTSKMMQQSMFSYIKSAASFFYLSILILLFSVSTRLLTTSTGKKSFNIFDLYKLSTITRLTISLKHF